MHMFAQHNRNSDYTPEFTTFMTRNIQHHISYLYHNRLLQEYLLEINGGTSPFSIR